MYHPGFKLSGKITQQILTIFSQFLGESTNKGISDTEARHLCDSINDLQEIDYESEVRIAITGDTGSGKSATVNSIFGEDGLTSEVNLPLRYSHLTPS